MLDQVGWHFQPWFSGNVFCGEVSKSGGQRSDEFQTEAESAAGANDCGQSGVHRRIEFDLQQVAGVEQDSGVQDHSSLAQLGSAAGNHGGGEAFSRHDANWDVDRQTWPAARIWGGCHYDDHRPRLARLQITSGQPPARPCVQANIW